MSVLGNKPQLLWIDKRLLQVEPEYQRELSLRRSQDLIAKLAENYCWAYGSALIVAAAEDFHWTIIDGQHRHAAAMRRDDIKDLPCLIVEAASIEARAKAFVAHNRDRVTLHFLALFYADIAAGDETAKAVLDTCQEVGVTILRTAKTVGDMLPAETMAVGAMRQIASSMGNGGLAQILRLVRAAYPDKRGELRSGTIKAVATLVQMGVAEQVIVKALSATNGLKLENEARALRAERGLSLTQAFSEVLACACGTTTIRSKKAEAVPKPAAKKPEQPQRGKPFRFDRSDSAAPQVKPQEVRSNVQVRRFEPGASGVGSDDFLKRCGYDVSKRPNGYDVKKTGAPGKPKRMTHAQVIDLLNAERKKRGLQPATVAKGAA